jgi:hypothetical protein
MKTDLFAAQKKTNLKLPKKHSEKTFHTKSNLRFSSFSGN